MKGLRFETTLNWATKYRSWKRIIKAFLYYRRPLTLNEIVQFLKTKFPVARKYMQMMMEDGLVVKEGNEYKLVLPNVRKRIKIVEPDEYEKELEHIQIINCFEVYGPEWVVEAIDYGIVDDAEIYNYMWNRAKAVVEMREGLRNIAKINGVHKSTINSREELKRRKHNREVFNELWEKGEKGEIGKIMKGEDDIEKYFETGYEENK